MTRFKVFQNWPQWSKNDHSGFPTQQLFILALCRICEPIAFMSIFPYIYYMIESFNITSDSNQIAVYAGMVTSSFALAEFSSSVIWGRISDKIGRKPVLLGGLAGTAISMLVFGFAKSLPVVLIGRALGGLLNGNIAVLQTTVAELVKVKEHQPRAYSIMPFVWCLGSILGPALGGALAQPVQNYPSLFDRGSLFDTYPFLLPNLVCVCILGCGVIVGTLFLQETHTQHKHRRDLGLEFGHWLLGMITQLLGVATSTSMGDSRNPDELEKLLPPDEQDSHPLSESSPTHPSTSDVIAARSGPVGAHKAFTRPVIMNIVAYGVIAYHAICFDQMMPIFLSLPPSHTEPTLPFKFTGGFGMSSQTVGVLLAIQGVYSMLAQVLLFPFVVKRFGTLVTFRTTVILWPLLYLLVPYLVFLPAGLQKVGIVFCLLWRITAQVLAFPSMTILITNSAPSFAVLGLVNGVAGSAACLSRTFGPTLSGTLLSWGTSIGYTGIAWWTAAIIAFIGAIQSFWMQEVQGRVLTEKDARDEERLDPR